MVGWAVDGAGSEDSFSFEFFLAALLLKLLLRLLLSIAFCLFKMLATISFIVSVSARMVGPSATFIVAVMSFRMDLVFSVEWLQMWR